jgi:hypothetical protein
LLLGQPITGLGDVVFHGRPFTLFIWQVPALFVPDAAIRSLFREAHELGAKALLALIGLHAGAALFHGLVLRDGVLQQMLPLSIRISFLSARANAGRRMLVGTLWSKITLWIVWTSNSATSPGSSALLSLAAASGRSSISHGSQSVDRERTSIAE